jgi:LacI family transcriptional regulator
MTKRPTIIDVARLAGVSKATVGRVVNGQDDIVSEETRQRVMSAISQLDYERNAIAGSLRTDKTNVIALCIPDITNPYWPEVARGVQDTLEAQGYAVMTVNSDWDADREVNYLKLVRRNRFDGLIINPASTRSDFRDMNIPIVMLGTGDRYPGYDAVGSDSESAQQEALAYLYQLGHRRIALIAGLSQRGRTMTRYHAYVSFLACHELRLDASLVVHCDFTIQGGADAMVQLLAMPDPPTAIFAANDIIAIGALQAAHTQGWRVPQEISIVGMDDIYAAATTSPPLTTVRKPKYETGAEAARLLLARMNGDQSPVKNLKLPCVLVQRGSAAAPRQ